MSAPGPVTGSRWKEAPLCVRRSGRRWQPANVARPPRARPLPSGALSGNESRSPPSACRHSASAEPSRIQSIPGGHPGDLLQPRGAREGVTAHRARGSARANACGGHPPPVSRIFWAGKKGRPSNLRPPAQDVQPPHCPCVCGRARWKDRENEKGRLGQPARGAPLNSPAFHQDVWATCVVRRRLLGRVE